MTSPIEAAHPWDAMSSAELREHLAPVRRSPGFAAEVLRYANGPGDRSYDEVGSRFIRAAPCGDVPLRVIIPGQPTSALREWSDAVDGFEAEAAALRHRLLDSPVEHFVFGVDERFIWITPKNPAPGVPPGPWAFSLSARPPFMEVSAIDRDVVPVMNRVAEAGIELGIAGAAWLSAFDLIRCGRFEAMQGIRNLLTTETRTGSYYCFVSHRWLSPTHPDPRGEQYRMLCWQLVGHLCAAIRIAQRRGLHVARKFNTLLNVRVGIAGSDLAESLLVGVLRPNLAAEQLASVWDEVRSFEAVGSDYGVTAAQRADAVQVLASELQLRPRLAALLRHILIWYDYCCLPQAPRSAEDEALFATGLRNATGCQMAARTVILLDDADDYLSRAWCTLEATHSFEHDVLVGSTRAAPLLRSQRGHLRELLLDRPHVIWRAILDTELFHVQTPSECMRRLNLSVTDPRDEPILYDELVERGAPRAIHFDSAELITGVFPLPARAGSVVMSRYERSLPSRTPKQTLHIDLLRGRRLGSQVGAATPLPPWIALGRAPTAIGRCCHVALVAGCEGEASLMAERCLRHRLELEALAQAQLASLSWMACDVAPVGHFPVGTLTPRAVEAEVWIVVASAARWDRGGLLWSLLAAVAHASGEWIEVVVDRSGPKPNVRVLGKVAEDSEERNGIEIVDPGRLAGVCHAGGLFRSDILQMLIP